jgi:transcriptional regulator with XRE-family HTH domain
MFPPLRDRGLKLFPPDEGYNKQKRLILITLDMQDLKAIGARIKSFRKSNNISQIELAEATGYNKKTISLSENGHRPPTQKLLSHLSEKYHLDLDWVSSGKGDQINDKIKDPSSPANLQAKIIEMEIELREMKKVMEQILGKIQQLEMNPYTVQKKSSH